MLVYLRQVVGGCLNNCLAVLAQLGGRVQRRHIMRKLLISIEEELDTSKARLVWLELEAPFDGRRGLG